MRISIDTSKLTSKPVDSTLKDLARQVIVYPVAKSNNVRGLGYDENNKLLVVAFGTAEKVNSKYVYENVSKETFDSITSAVSIGKKLYEAVIKQKDKYKYTKL